MSVDPISERGDSAESSSSGSAKLTGGVNLPATLKNGLPAAPSLGWPYGPPAKPEILKAKPNPAELLHAVRRRWPLPIGLGTLVATTIVALLWFLSPVYYAAFARVTLSGTPLP